MAIVEAMSMGCIPVIYRGGGPWTDTLEETEGKYGYSYMEASEAASRIEQVLGDSDLRANLRENSLKRSQDFNVEKFTEKTQNILKNIEPIKKEDWLTAFYKLVKKIEALRVPW